MSLFFLDTEVRHLYVTGLQISYVSLIMRLLGLWVLVDDVM